MSADPPTLPADDSPGEPGAAGWEPGAAEARQAEPAAGTTAGEDAGRGGVAPRPTRTLTAYRLAERVPLGIGRALFSRGLRLAAPYFLTIPASISSVEPGRAVARMRHLPWVRNHLGTVHAIALCNLAEMTMGVLAEATVPSSHRWIPKGMTVEYRAKARGTMTATATMKLPDPLPGADDRGTEVPVAVTVTDPAGVEVFRAEIRLWITASR